MNKGKCKLCLDDDADLRVSHFMPRALYALLGTDEYEPVRFSREAIYPTSMQTKHPLFCGACEQVLNREGENWLIPLLPNIGGLFPLRESLMKQPPIYQHAGSTLYAAAKNPEIDAAKLIHFAVGLFYKAAVHSWRGGIIEPYVDLRGDTEALRLYLLGIADLPRHIVLTVTVDSSTVIWQAMVEPYRAESEKDRRYLFYLPGVLFQLFVANGMQEEKMAHCINGDPLRPILLEDVSKPMRNATREVTVNSRKTKKLLETTAEIEAKGLRIRLGE